jgi:hypothetical protein
MTEAHHNVASRPSALPNGSRRRGPVPSCQPMNKRFLRVIALGLGWLVIAALVAVLLFPLQVAKFRRIDANSRMTTGVIINKDCRYNEQVTYTFDIGGKKYRGAHASESCYSATFGQHISVYYNAQNPAENTTWAPPHDFHDGILTIVLNGVILSSLITWEISKSWRFGNS